MIVTTFSDNSYLEFGKGSFDDWCVFLSRPNMKRCAPKDWQYFKRLQMFAEKHGTDKVYNDFVHIFENTTKELSNDMFEEIKTMSNSYGEDEISAAIVFSILYMGMVAEENKAFSILGKRVKHLGVHQVLKENMDYSIAANFSKGKKWRELDVLCKERGF